MAEAFLVFVPFLLLSQLKFSAAISNVSQHFFVLNFNFDINSLLSKSLACHLCPFIGLLHYVEHLTVKLTVRYLADSDFKRAILASIARK